MKKRRSAAGGIAALVIALMTTGFAETNAPATAMIRIGAVTASGKYAFVVIHRGGEGAEVVRLSVKQAVQDAGGRAEAVEVDVADAVDGPTVREYRVDQARLPLVLAIAPNGAVTGRFPDLCESQSLINAMLGPKGASCMKALQAGKVVVIRMEPPGSKTAEATGQVVAAFASDPRVADFVESILIHTTDWEDHGFLDFIGLDPKSEVATTLLMTPPNRIAGMYTNRFTVDALFADLTRAMTGATCSGDGCKPSADGGPKVQY